MSTVISLRCDDTIPPLAPHAGAQPRLEAGATLGIGRWKASAPALALGTGMVGSNRIITLLTLLAQVTA